MPAKSTKRAEVGTKTAPVKAKQQQEEDINRLPVDIDTDEDNSVQDIKKTRFVKGSSKATSIASSQGKESPRPAVKDKISWKDENGKYQGTSRPLMRATRGNGALSSSTSTNSPKRSREEGEGTKLGAGMQDGLGFIKKTNKRVKGYGGSSQSRLASSRRSAKGKPGTLSKFHREGQD